MQYPPSTVIIGAGPAGLTAAYELSKAAITATVLESGPLCGGLARTEQYKGYRFDIGGHRFYTKVEAVERLWNELLGEDFILRPRLSRIYYRGRFFRYPLEPADALRGLGFWNATACLLSFLRVRLSPIRPERTLDAWISNRFGRRLLAALGAARLDLQPRWAAMAAVTMAVVFSLPVIVIMEMTPAQPSYFLKSIDETEYLRRTLPPYGAVDYLVHHATTDDAIASVGNWAAAYSPNPAKFDHVYRTKRHYTAADVAAVMSGERKYLILPNHGNLGDLQKAAAERYKLTRLYADQEFIVYGLAR